MKETYVTAERLKELISETENISDDFPKILEDAYHLLVYFSIIHDEEDASYEAYTSGTMSSHETYLAKCKEKKESKQLYMEASNMYKALKWIYYYTNCFDSIYGKITDEIIAYGEKIKEKANIIKQQVK